MNRHFIEDNSCQRIEKYNGQRFKIAEPFWVYEKKEDPFWVEEKELVAIFKTKKDAEDYVKSAETINQKEVT